MLIVVGDLRELRRQKIVAPLREAALGIGFSELDLK
jgi:hypothetical protein